ncbi:MAG: hypothetical protein OHK0046_10880 [Anaerolineae bacterium]
MDGPHTRTIQTTLRGWLASLVLIGLGIFILSVLWTLFIDSRCVAGANTWLPDYPDAAEVSSEYTFLRMYGIGSSTRVLVTQDDPDTVEDWYRASDRQNGFNSASRGGAFTRWRVAETPGGGTEITLASQCASNLDLSPLGLGRGE